MQKTDAPLPKVFISYSWTSPAHINWVVELAERLVRDGVNVMLDKWDLKEGHDKYAFMEKMVLDPEVTKVLILSDKEYAEKGDERRGGVGTESQIISKEIYDKVSQDKFIPVVLSYDPAGIPSLPVFLRSRIYIDLSSPEKTNENYEQLLRTIFNRPALQKPTLGKPPAHIFVEKTSYSPNRLALEAFKNSLREDKSNYVALAREFLNAFATGLEVFRINPNKSTIEEHFLSSIHDMLPARNELIEFYEAAFAFKEDAALVEVLLEFLERCLLYNYPASDMQSWDDLWFDNFAFFNHEAFIYLAAVLVKYKRDAILNFLMSHEYYVDIERRPTASRLLSYTRFRSHSKILESKNKKLKQQRLSPEADLFRERAVLPSLSFRAFMEADFVLFLRSVVNDVGYYQWFPNSLAYAGWSEPFPLFARARSAQGFLRVAKILGVSSRQELKKKYDDAMAGPKGQGWGTLTFHADVSFRDLMNYKEITAGTENA